MPPLSRRATQIVIEPFDPAVSRALALIREKHGDLLNESKVEKIIVHPGAGPHFGEVRSGPGENPRHIHLFKGRIEAEARKWLQGGAPADALAKAIEYAIVGTLGHEAGHMKSEQAPQEPFHGEGRAEEKSRETLRRIYPQGLPLAAMMLDHLRRKLVPSAPFAEPDLAFVARVASGDRQAMVRHAMRIFRHGGMPILEEMRAADDFNGRRVRESGPGRILGFLEHLAECPPCEPGFSEYLAKWQAGNGLAPTGRLDDVTLASARARMPSFRNFPRNFGIVWNGKLFRGGQPDNLGQLAAMRDRLGVRRIVSLNEDMPELAGWCGDLGLEHVQASLGGGHPDEEGWSVIGPCVAGFMTSVPTFVHCRHGMDRTGGVVAACRTDRGWPCDLAYREAKAYGFKDRFVDMVDNMALRCRHDPASHRHPPFDTDVVRRALAEQEQDVLDATPSDLHYTGLGSSMDDSGYDSGALTILNPFSRQVPFSLPGGGGR
jgi:hypothetical protein